MEAMLMSRRVRNRPDSSPSQTTRQPQSVLSCSTFTVSSTRKILTPRSSFTTLVIHHARVYTVGEIYQVPELKTLAAARFREAASFVCVNYEDLAQAIKEIYESTPTGDRTLRDAARDVVMEKLDELISDDAFMHTMEEVGAFAMLLSRALWEKMNKMKEKMQEMVAKGKITPHFECPGCLSHEVIHGHEAFKPKKIVECPRCESAYTWKTWKEQVVREE